MTANAATLCQAVRGGVIAGNTCLSSLGSHGQLPLGAANGA